jgi:hypothetical protein
MWLISKEMIFSMIAGRSRLDHENILFEMSSPIRNLHPLSKIHVEVCYYATNVITLLLIDCW